MRVTASHDLDAETVQVSMTFPIGTPPDRAADEAWATVDRAVARAQRAKRERDAVPEGLRPARTAPLSES